MKGKFRKRVKNNVKIIKEIKGIFEKDRFLGFKLIKENNNQLYEYKFQDLYLEYGI